MSNAAPSSFANRQHTWREVHDDVEAKRVIGTYGADNAPYHGLAGIRAGVDMSKFHSQRSPDEFYVESLEQLLRNPQTQQQWEQISTIDPLGMFATRPTMAATEACMTICELQQHNKLEADGVIVNNDLTINCVKCAIDHVWNLQLLAKKLKMDEKTMREALAKSTQNDHLLDTSINTYLPPVGGVTVYFFGDISKLQQRSTEVAVRVHDECCGSDVFGTDICTCRPYLIFALQGAIQCAQRGGVGIIVYFRKEGRSLGEVTKFRVYNARKRQQGGDTAANYFKQTEGIAGIRDARFQEMMPDILLWLGLTRIDWLLSMSSDKYDAIISAGIEVMQRVSLPDSYVPPAAVVEITAKISAGYHTDAIDQDDVANELRSLQMIRQRCSQIYHLAELGKSKHFSLNLSKLNDVTDYVWKVMLENYGPDLRDIPYHSRWRHFDPHDVDLMIHSWRSDPVEKARRLIDLVTISVLMDAGAGSSWKYIDSHGHIQERSEGLAIATFDMFSDGIFSSDPHCLPHRVNSHGLKSLSLKTFSKGLQISESNNITGLEGRFKLLKRIGKALSQHPQYFGYEVCRPGNIVDFVLKHATVIEQNGDVAPHSNSNSNSTNDHTDRNNNNNSQSSHSTSLGIHIPTTTPMSKRTVSLNVLWQAVIEGFESIWPQHLSGVRRGDVWCYSSLKQVGKPASDLIPFHKLSQWLTYSLLEPLEALGITFTDMSLMTGLAEYRNGGLFVDLEVIIPKRSETLTMMHDAGSELVVEWRALTICLIDEVWSRICSKIGLTKEEFPLAKVLQGGTWSAGRKIAEEKRHNRTSPIQVRSDGTVF